MTDDNQKNLNDGDEIDFNSPHSNPYFNLDDLDFDNFDPDEFLRTGGAEGGIDDAGGESADMMPAITQANDDESAESQPRTEEETGRKLQDLKYSIACSVMGDADPLGVIADGAPFDEYDGEAAIITCCVAANATIDEAESAITAILGATNCDGDGKAPEIARKLIEAWTEAGVNDLREIGLTSVEDVTTRIAAETERVNDEYDNGRGSDGDSEDDDADEDAETTEDDEAPGEQPMKIRIGAHLVLKILMASAGYGDAESADYDAAMYLFEYHPDYRYGVASFHPDEESEED